MTGETAVLLNISEMIDLAIGTPEVGVVDFNMLQTILHCLAQQLRVHSKHVELRGDSFANLPVHRENTQTIAISEYLVDTEETPENTSKKNELVITPTPTGPETVLVVERIKKTDSPDQSAPRGRSSLPHGLPSHTQPGLSSPEKLSLVTLSKFNILENTVEDLKSRVYGSIPTNEGILEEVRSQTNVKAITDMWTSLNVSSRLEAAETGIAKLSSLVQDLIGETTELQEAVERHASERSIEGPPPTSAPLPSDSARPAIPATLPPPGSIDVTKADLPGIRALLEKMRRDLDHLTNTFYTTMEEMNVGFTPPLPPLSSPRPTAGTAASPSSNAKTCQAVSQRRHCEMTTGLLQRINDLEMKLKECCDKTDKNDGIIQDQINSFQDQLDFLMKRVAGLTEDLSVGKLSPDLIKDLQGLMHLFKTVQEMQDQLKLVHETALQLAAEKENRQGHMNALLEQIELLKTIKLDREDMVEAMAEKADLRLLARKVSKDQFEIACDDLSRGLEHALGKLNIQETLWQQALDDIQREIETKLDKMELSPVKDFFDNKLRQLQENLKQMAALRREVEAAGTKRKLLRDVNCISCDAKAVMAMEEQTMLPLIKPMPANLSMKPYLSYELDAIRKSQASNLPQRNMHDWEKIDKQMTSKPSQRPRSETDKHICNRYCGGSHTVTTPAQRVTRFGHFVKQWGPDVLPLTSGIVAGDDGRMYRVSPVEGANVGPAGIDTTCTPRSPQKGMETTKPVQKSIVISPECRCLDGGNPVKG